MFREMIEGLCGLLALAAMERTSAADPPRPNFVVILVDDLGYGDIAPFGSPDSATPRLSQMAREGAKFTSFYSAAAVCSPSRTALLTGCYPIRVGLADGPQASVLFPGDPIGLNRAETTLAEVLQDAGYATGCFGKWHLGDQPEFLPTRHGFDEFLGIPYLNDMWPLNPGGRFPPLPLLHNERIVGEIETMHDQSLLGEKFTRAACDFLRRNRERPFLLLLPNAFIHHPRAARPEFLQQAALHGESHARPLTLDKRLRTQAQIEEIDWSAGQISDTLRALDLAEQTRVIFTSDNGGALGSRNAPLRGMKGTAWEGGFRVPIVWGTYAKSRVH